MKNQTIPTLAINEEIRDIKGFEGHYAVTSYGRVWSYKSHKFLSPGVDKFGYCIVVLCKNGKRKTCKVHRLVAEAFLANPDGKPQVNHKDENKTNNNIINLEWMTAVENINYGTRNNRCANTKAFSVYCIELDKTWPRPALAAKDMGVTSAAISYACNGKNRTSCGYHWEYVA